MLKARLLALVLIIVGAFLVYINWHELHADGTYSIKLAAFGPLVAIGGVFLMLFPTKAGKPETTSEKIIAMVVFAIGIVAGLANWYLMDPGFFGR